MDKVSFRFKLPKKGYSLASVSIKDGRARLGFKRANCAETPTLSEEDVATLARLKGRPGFAFIAIPPHHPYFGRQYKCLSHEWLKGTSVGELLAEADWVMKTLSIGAKTNDTKDKFWAAYETSKLEGRLGTVMDFPCNEDEALENGSSVIMSCKLAKVVETDEDLIFDEIKMQIVHSGNASYTKYITEMYDSIGHYDEPLLLKMKELIKLILAMEFLREKGVTFDEEWYMSQTTGNKSAPQAIEVSDSAIPKVNFEEMVDQIPHQLRELMSVDEMTNTHATVSVKAEGKEMKTTVSVKNYNELHKGFDPRMPIGLETPNVESWSELFRETVPWPCVWNLSLEEPQGIHTSGGGVSTSHIPTHVRKETTASSRQTPAPKQHGVKRKDQYESCNGSLSVLSSTPVEPMPTVKPPPKEMLPKGRVCQPPRRNVDPNTERSCVNNAMARLGPGPLYGYEDGASAKMFDSNGTEVLQGESLKFASQMEDENGGTHRMLLQVPLPPTVGGASPQSMVDSGYGESEVSMDTGTSDQGDDSCFSPRSDDGTFQFPSVGKMN